MIAEPALVLPSAARDLRNRPEIRGGEVIRRTFSNATGKEIATRRAARPCARPDRVAVARAAQMPLGWGLLFRWPCSSSCRSDAEHHTTSRYGASRLSMRGNGIVDRKS